MIGMRPSTGSFLISETSSNPSMPGSERSVIIRSGRDCSRISSAALLSAAGSTSNDDREEFGVHLPGILVILDEENHRTDRGHDSALVEDWNASEAPVRRSLGVS